MREVNPQIWYGERELNHVPPHFVKATTVLTNEALNWVNSKLIGRYTLSTYNEINTYIFESNTHIYFEDPSEAMMYELRWSGTK